MKMYVANCTRQPHDFAYRVPEEKGLRMQRIEAGGQVGLSGDLNQLQVDSIVQQHAAYGMVNVKEIDRAKPFFGTCYSIDKTINVSDLREAIVHNQDVLEERGAELRKTAAVAINQGLEDQGAATKGVEISVTEEKQGTGEEHEPLSETVRVDRNADPGKNQKKK